jgi:predicted glycoside hydrolase/deacetylase ChbG (UPF0249 family)
MPPRLILNADDFGLTPGINLPSTTLMATGPAFHHAVQLALRTPTLGVGCHLVFTGGIPVSHPDSIPSLLGADGKTFRPSALDFAQAALRGTLRPEELAREALAQIQCLQRAGIDVTHVDTHKHTHIFPLVAETVFHIAQRCGIQSIRHPIEPRWSSSLAPGRLRRCATRVFELFQPSFDRLTRPAALRGLIPQGTLGIAATGSLTAPLLRSVIDCLVHRHPDSVFELLCHPGYNDPDLAREPTVLRQSREVEYHALLEVIPPCLPGNRSTLPAVELIHYGNLGVPGLQRASGQYVPATGFEKVL